ncbi:hypothetical protein F4824DRAFT_326272 [Ustulina deusta]|nr:hypothetical protein F4824DRAFT_326272 [Ustulina deusta]
MAASHHHEESVNKRITEKAAHRHNHQTKMERATLFLSHIITWPFRVIRQAWKDYQSGRNMRKWITQEQDPKTGDDRPREAEDKTKKLRGRREIPVLATEGSSSSQYYHEDRRARSARHRPVIEHWVHQGGEWPWRIEQVVHRDASGNARGIWVLEVKDMSAMYWETKDRPGRRVPATVPQAQWPFPRQGKRDKGVNDSIMEEPDELMEWLWRP